MSIGKKLYFFIRLKIYFFTQWVKEAITYYSNFRYMAFDILFCFIYLFLNPYKEARKFLEKKLNKKVHDYGETPIETMEKIVKNFNIQKENKILDLGAGRGKICFWLYFFFRCRVTAIEQISSFVKIARFLIKIFKIKTIDFLCKDFFDHDFENFDVIYLYGTTLGDEQILNLISKFKKLSSQTKIITVSYSLDEYDDAFICKKELDITFPWGKTKAYLNFKRS